MVGLSICFLSFFAASSYSSGTIKIAVVGPHTNAGADNGVPSINVANIVALMVLMKKLAF